MLKLAPTKKWEKYLIFSQIHCGAQAAVPVALDKYSLHATAFKAQGWSKKASSVKFDNTIDRIDRGVDVP